MEHRIPYITIVTSTYNSGRTLQRLLDSIASQEYESYEHIIIDGASSDDTLNIIRNNIDNISYWVSEKDTGVYDAWNKATLHIKGEWVIYLGSDDYFYDSAVLTKVANKLYKVYPQYTIVYGKLFKVDVNQKALAELGEPWETICKERDPLMKFPPHPATFHHRSLFEKINYFDTNYKYAADLKFVGTALKERKPLFIDEYICCFSIGGLTNSNINLLEKWKESNKLLKDLNIIVSKKQKYIGFLKVLIVTLIMLLFGKNGYTYLLKYYQRMRINQKK